MISAENQSMHKSTQDTVIHQPNMNVKFQHNNDWSSGLMGCCEDMKVCCCVYWCPCIVGCEVDKAIGVMDKF